MTDSYVEQVTKDWNAQGYGPHDIGLWEMLCGYLDIHRGSIRIGLLPMVLHPLMLDEPRAQAVRQWFGKQQALPVEERDGGYVALLADWRERLRSMQYLFHEALVSVDYQAFGYLPWYYHLDFPDDDELCQGDD